MKKLFLFAALAVLACVQGVTLAAQRHRAADERITNGPVVEGVGDTWATIAWTTNTGGSTIVRYGKNRDKMDQMSEAPYADNDKASAQNHRVQLKNLEPHTTYYFSVDSGQGEGTGTDAKSRIGQFTTKSESEKREGRR
ncbi:MAG TPA: fibronectin type III domain-containing protein [Candidatus Angelobacter sp.]|nr:fibronectin type III domain-containing protein [Candidatus Angelobacter sp.]